MKERGILYSGDMVRAILDGRKWQTRQVIKRISKEPDRWTDEGWNIYDLRYRAFTAPPDGTKWQRVLEKCPYGVVGDRLYVRETWGVTRLEGPGKTLEYPNVLYRANSSTILILGETKVWDYCVPKEEFRWRPSIHMPKWASRIWLEITDIRVERVQDISEDDAISEGIERVFSGPFGFRDYEWLDQPPRGTNCISSFSTFWDSINAKRGYGWQINPWVWVISFKVLE